MNHRTISPNIKKTKTSGCHLTRLLVTAASIPVALMTGEKKTVLSSMEFGV